MTPTPAAVSPDSFPGWAPIVSLPWGPTSPALCEPNETTRHIFHNTLAILKSIRESWLALNVLRMSRLAPKY